MVLDPLSRRIAGALQVDGRASWRRVAEVLEEPPRTVARRGAALLSSGQVRVVALASDLPSHVLRVSCAPASASRVAQAISAWPRSVFVYRTAGGPGVVAELDLDPELLDRWTSHDMDPLPGVHTYVLRPVARHLRTVARWRAGMLTESEAAALERLAPVDEQYRPAPQLDALDRVLIAALRIDGRTPAEQLASASGASLPTVRRRLDQLRSDGVVHIRAVVEPRLIGLPVEAMLHVTASPGGMGPASDLLVQSPWVRYAAMMLGGTALEVNAATPDVAALHTLVADLSATTSVETNLVARATKRSGVEVPVSSS